MTDWIASAEAATRAARAYSSATRERVAASITVSGKVDGAAADREQRLVHGFAWIATTTEALGAGLDWAKRSRAAGRFNDIEELTLRVAFGEYMAQLLGGVPMSQNEFARPRELGVGDAAATLADDPAVKLFLEQGTTAGTRLALSNRLRAGELPDESFDDESMDLIRRQFRDFTRERIAPFAHGWHLEDALIPDEVIQEMASLGVFGVCIEEEFGGLGLGKLAMSLVSEELSRGWICAGSLGTRSEIAGELIGANGTSEQKAHWLPRLATGEVLPTAVFTEPDVGSDLASVRTKATKQADGSWSITGAKNWITHAARADLMTVLCRTNSTTPGYGGLSMLLAAKQRRDGENDFPDDGLYGSEIGVLGYRGMREYALSFEDFQSSGRGPAWRRRGAGLQAAYAHVRGCPHPDCRSGRRCRLECLRCRP